jgi:hypothetical protein
MRITVVGAALVIGAVILAVVVIRTLADWPQSTAEAS